MRITILGLSASGKTTLAKKIAKRTGIPRLEIDRTWFSEGDHSAKSEKEKERVRKKIEAEVAKFIKKPNWVSDGLYRRVQPEILMRADIIVFLDVPLWRRWIRHAKRIYRKDRHPELDWWSELSHFHAMLKLAGDRFKYLQKFLEKYPEKVVRLKSGKDIGNFLSEITKQDSQLREVHKKFPGKD